MSSMTGLMQRLHLRHPIIQAPMAGGGDTPELATAVSNAGGMGSLGVAYMTPAQITDIAARMQRGTNRSFALNLFAPTSAPEMPDWAQQAVERLMPFHAELGLPDPTLPQGSGPAFDEQLKAVLESEASAFSFTFNLLSKEAVAAAKAKGKVVIGTATTVAEAIALERSGVDVVVAQGSEAGGHRGSFIGPFEMAMIGTMALVPQVVDAVKIPVIASGGIMDGRGIAAALALGASAVQMGTAFLTCAEAGIAEAYKELLLTSAEDQSRLTRAFSGRPARGLVNRAMTTVEDAGAPAAVLPFPLQNNLTRAMRQAASKQDRTDYLSLWAGQGVRMARRQKAADLVASLVTEMETAIEGLRRRNS